MSWTAGVRHPVRPKDFSLLHTVQTGSGAHPTFYQMGTMGSFHMDKASAGSEADNSAPSGTEVKNGGSIPPLPIRFYGVALN
jgi:hypothetical protein